MDISRFCDQHTSVVGLQWGDEGKGKIVDILSEGFDLAVRWNGGSNAGHSVQVGDQKYAFHLIPSAILRPQCISVLANGVVVDPSQLIREIDALEQRGIHVNDNLKISSQAHVVMPYHSLQDKLAEEKLGDKKIGTTARGIGPCYADKASRHFAVRMADIIDPDRLRDRLVHIVPEKNAIFAALFGSSPMDWRAIYEQYEPLGQRLKPLVCNTTALLHRAMAGAKKVLFEGANATLLDLDHGTFPFVTSSNCGTGVCVGAGVPPQSIGRILGVVKAYSSRVGSGPFPTEQENAIGEKIRDRGREYGTTTGRPRRCGWLDLVAVRYAAAVTGATGLCIMLLDVLSTFDEIKICTRYTTPHGDIDEFPADAGELSRVKPVYHTMRGWHDDLKQIRHLDALPPEARAYLGFIEEFVGVPVKMVSIGPGRDETLLIH